MRLIDADELIKHKGNCYDARGHLLYAIGTGNILKAPTIEAEPVRHGRWEPYKEAPDWDQKQCSVCGDISCCQRNYCPNCGAKMDGGDDDETD